MRTLSPYEKTHLARFGLSNLDPSQIGDQPVEYLTGKVEFYDQIFKVTPDVLIPRIETEELVKIALEEIKKSPKKSLKIADLGTGSGAIGLTLLLQSLKLEKGVDLWLSDISPKALKVATQNYQQIISKVEAKSPKIKTNQFTFLESDLLANYPPGLKFDLITANLPYIPSNRIKTLESSVKDFEPILALDGGPTGLEIIAKLVKSLPNYLQPNGKIILEIDHTHTQEKLEELIPQRNGQKLLKVRTLTDSFGKNRFALYSG